MNKLIASLVAALLCSLALAACGGDDNGSTTSGSSETVKIGVEGPITGEQSQTGVGMVNGAQLAADEINAEGGIDGKKIEIVQIDDAADPDTGVKAANAAVEQGLDGVIGPYNSGVGLETLPIYEKAGLVPVRLTSDNGTDGMGITLQPMTDQIAPAASQAMTEWLNAKSVAVIWDDTTAYTKGVASAVLDELKQAGVKITSTPTIDPKNKSFTEQVKTAAADDPDVIYVVAYFPEAGIIAREMDQEGVKPQCFADYGAYDPGFVETAGTAAAKKCPVLGVPAADDFPDGPGFVKKYGEAFDGAQPGAWTAYTYDSMKALAEVAGQVGFKEADLTPALFGIEDWSGLTGKVTIEPRTGSRTPSTLAVTVTDDQGELHVDQSWSDAVGAGY